jgi:hypothetical protein
MALFLVAAIQNGAAAVDSAITAKIQAEERYQIESGKWVVSMDAPTAKAVSDTLGLTENATHITLPIRGYFGRSQPDLWEWLAAKSARVNA